MTQPAWFWRWLDADGREVVWLETSDALENYRIINEHPDAIRLVTLNEVGMLYGGQRMRLIRPE